MFKKIVITTALIAISGVLIFGAINRTQAKAYNTGVDVDQAGNSQGNFQAVSYNQDNDVYARGQGGGGGRGQGGGGQGSASQDAAGQQNPPAATGELSAEEAAALIYMREEEKLAHDVYVTLYAKWGLPVFQNISQSEQAHTDTIKALLDRYGLSDPASGTVGVFTNPDLQALYTDLVARGSQSLAEAIEVGATIEEIDILDLEERQTQTDNADIQQVYNNLMSGSYNHLRAFVSTLKTQTGEVYQPQYLSPEAYQVILNASAGNGNGRGGSGQGGGRGGRP